MTPTRRNLRNHDACQCTAKTRSFTISVAAAGKGIALAPDSRAETFLSVFCADFRAFNYHNFCSFLRFFERKCSKIISLLILSASVYFILLFFNFLLQKMLLKLLFVLLNKIVNITRQEYYVKRIKKTKLIHRKFLFQVWSWHSRASSNHELERRQPRAGRLVSILELLTLESFDRFAFVKRRQERALDSRNTTLRV